MYARLRNLSGLLAPYDAQKHQDRQDDRDQDSLAPSNPCPPCPSQQSALFFYIFNSRCFYFNHFNIFVVNHHRRATRSTIASFKEAVNSNVLESGYLVQRYEKTQAIF